MYKWKNKRYALATLRNINAAFKKDSVNERTIRRWYTKFETGDESLTNEDLGKPETVVDHEIE